MEHVAASTFQQSQKKLQLKPTHSRDKFPRTSAIPNHQAAAAVADGVVLQESPVNHKAAAAVGLFSTTQPQIHLQ